MNRSELVAAVADRAGLTPQQAQSALDATVEAIVTAVAGGAKVALPGFGTFEPRERGARTGRNPQTGATIEIPATRAPAFKPGAQFKERVRG
jgi:DNA-binding protein HU-beta